MSEHQTNRPRSAGGRDGAGKTQSSRQQADFTDEAEQLELFDKPLAPLLPGRRTLAYQVLLHLLAGEAVTQPLWLDLAGSWRLAASIGLLKNNLGWPIVATSIDSPTPETPNRKIASYRMSRAGIDVGRELLRQARRAAA